MSLSSGGIGNLHKYEAGFVEPKKNGPWVEKARSI